ncbi:hypothetical protein QTO34_012801 [Cnephaeus nilssonii]|uniref:ZU5 domain-containing protein n=1 Tax=Cnephaeus nilssonii TaxID=3371016 RepID=A0AA40HAV8_CNENI|nr:hypothetical protein QTO34_012801 [Eptesicus nilssonii]
MKPQSVLTRVKMFENKRSASMENKKDENHTGFKPPEAASKPPGAPVVGPKATLQSQFSEHDKTLYRIPEPQKPQPKPPEDIVRSNHYDPEEDEEYYRKQLSYFDRRSFENKPSAHIPAGHLPEPAKPAHPQHPPGLSSYSAKGKSADADAFGDRRYDSVQPTPPPPPLPAQYSQPPQPSSSSSLHAHAKGAHGEGNSVSLDFQNSLVSKPEPPPSQNKPVTFRTMSREEPAQPTFYPQKSFPDKAPVNGTEQPQKTVAPAYNRFTPKPYTSSARPFERKFESPKFSHNLLPSETAHKPDVSSKVPASPKTLVKAQPPEFDSGVETFSIHAEKPRYHVNNLSAGPRAVPGSPSAVEEDNDEDGHTVVATARGVFSSNGGVLSSIETGVSIIIPQGAIPEGVEQEIYFKVCRDNSILPPLDKEKGETLLSPLVMCGPHGLKFLKPVELRLPHCASMTPDGWSFALKSSDSSSGDPKTWQNKCLPGDPNYLVGANCVSVLIDHF